MRIGRMLSIVGNESEAKKLEGIVETLDFTLDLTLDSGEWAFQVSRLQPTQKAQKGLEDNVLV